MKFSSAIAAAGAAVTVYAADVALPVDFKVFYSNALTNEAAASLRFDDNEMVLSDNSRVTAVTVKRQTNGSIDLRAAYSDKAMQLCAMVGAIYAERPGVLRIGMGADWWFDCYCNGKYLYGTSDSGNGSWPPKSDNYIFDVPLRAGRNDLVIFSRSGAGGWQVVLDSKADSKEVHQPKFLPENPQIIYGPYLTNPGSGSVSINYVVRGRQPLELQYRKKGESIWQKKQILRGGQILDEGPVMRFDLTGLKEDTIYEYRALKRKGKDLRKIEEDVIREFRTLSTQSENFSFWIMSDTHKAKTDKLAMLQQLLDSRPELQKADMFVHLGDFNSFLDDIELEVFDSFLKLIPNHQYIITTRGNHEFDGAEAGRYIKYLGSRDNKSYQMFKVGNICFLALDTGHHLPPDSDNSFQRYAGLNELDTLLNEQTAWLQEAVKSEEFKNAAVRMVFAHIAPHSQSDEFNHMLPRLHKMTENLFKGSPAPYPVDLWFAGHIHKYQTAAADKEWQFPVITLGGGVKKSLPGAALYVEVKGKNVTVTAINSDGSTLEKFTLNNNKLVSANN